MYHYEIEISNKIKIYDNPIPPPRKSFNLIITLQQPLRLGDSYISIANFVLPIHLKGGLL